MLNWLVIGIGDITIKRVIPAIQSQPRSQLAGIVTRDPAKARAYNARAFTSLSDALATPEIDAVYVASPVFLHAQQTIESLRAGKHVLCEKPMAMNYSEARRMQTAATESGRTLGIAYYRRNYAKVQRAKELLHQGVIGKPVLAELTNHVWVDGNPPGNWRVDPAQAGGGPLFDIASHRIDLLNFWFGNPLRASAHTSNAVHKYPVEDNATVMVDYADGVRGIVDVRWHSRIVRDECRIRGTEGEMDLTPLNGPALVYPGAAEALPAHENLHYPCVDNFVNAVLDGATLLSSGASAMVTDRVTDWVIGQAQAR